MHIGGNPWLRKGVTVCNAQHVTCFLIRNFHDISTADFITFELRLIHESECTGHEGRSLRGGHKRMTMTRRTQTYPSIVTITTRYPIIGNRSWVSLRLIGQQSNEEVRTHSPSVWRFNILWVDWFNIHIFPCCEVSNERWAAEWSFLCKSCRIMNFYDRIRIIVFLPVIRFEVFVSVEYGETT